MTPTKASILVVAVLLIVILQVPTAMPARHLPPHNSPKRVRGETVEVAGSRLPDCSHACGSCAPCRLVMVRYFCSSVEDSETCPLAYKCMCSHKSFPVP
ncbi:Protein EPIDERMAL PATTERNING FACTOR 1, partial [Cucurbita argyrosperma subsp. argyrosperma]